MNCGLSCLTEDLSLSLLRGAFHGWTVIAHPPAGEKRGERAEWVRGVEELGVDTMFGTTVLETNERRGASFYV
jgi:hypothetical protein